MRIWEGFACTNQWSWLNRATREWHQWRTCISASPLPLVQPSAPSPHPLLSLFLLQSIQLCCLIDDPFSPIFHCLIGFGATSWIVIRVRTPFNFKTLVSISCFPFRSLVSQLRYYWIILWARDLIFTITLSPCWKALCYCRDLILIQLYCKVIIIIIIHNMIWCQIEFHYKYNIIILVLTRKDNLSILG